MTACPSGLKLAGMGERGQPILRGIERAQEFFFALLGLVVRLAPLGALGAMAFTVGKFGLGSLGNLMALMFCLYITSALFVLLVLGGIARWCGFSILRYLRFISDELILTLGTSSSETALPGLMEKSRRLGCQPATVGLVIPTGYSFNMDGTNIYLCMGAVFLAQATNTPMTWGQQLTLLCVAMLTSKGASGVTGSGFVTLAATLQAVPGIPLESIALLMGVDRFMSECRAVTKMDRQWPDHRRDKPLGGRGHCGPGAPRTGRERGLTRGTRQKTLIWGWWPRWAAAVSTPGPC